MTEKHGVDEGAVDSHLAEVWGDIVSRPQLGKAIMVSAVMSVCAYMLALRTIAPLASSVTVGKASAMLVGIAGAVLAGAICSITFPPKRILVLGPVSAGAWQSNILQQLELDESTIGSIDDEVPAVVDEMRAVGLYDVFKSFEDARHVDTRSVA